MELGPCVPNSTDYTNPNSNNNLVLENLHQSLNRQIDNVNSITASYSSTSSTLSPNTTTAVSPTSATANKNTCSATDSQQHHHGSQEKKKCIELQTANNNNNNNSNSNNSNSHNLMDPNATNNNSNNDELHLHGSLQKTHCCMPPISISSSVSSSAVTALPSTADLAREQWYVHHSAAHPHQQLPDEFVMYAPALPSTSPSSSIAKFGIESSTESYLSSRYNVNVKGVRHERTSSFFDIPAVTHPYCYRFPSSPPAGILKKNDDDPSFCNNVSVSSSLQFGQHYHNAKAEHPDSTTTHLTNHHPHTALPHNHHHHHQHHHHHGHAHSTNLHHQHAHLNSHSSAFKFSHTPSVYHHQYNGQASATTYGLRSAGEIAPSLALAAPVSTTTETDIKYENPYNSAISSTYALRQSSGVDSSTAVSSSDADFKLESLYAASNSITTSHTVSQRRGSLQLWQFLVALLDEPNTNSSCIAWTGRGMEFKLIEPEEVARRWGIQKNRPAMNYDKLSRSLRYYYEKGIMQKVNGERYVYRFVCDPEALFNMAYGHLGTSASAAATKADHQLQHHHLQQHHHHHLLASPTSSTKTTVDSIATSSLEDDVNRERAALNHAPGPKHHEQLFYGKF